MRDSRLTHSPNISLACGAMSLLIEAMLWKGNIGSLAGLVRIEVVTVLILSLIAWALLLPFIGIYFGARHRRANPIRASIGILLCVAGLAIPCTVFAYGLPHARYIV